MAASCFVSHSSKDYTEALSLVKRLEKKDIDCWIAPRNIDAGEDYSEAIVKAISECSSVIALISESSLSSRHVKSEVSLADNLGKTIFPVKLIDIEIYGGLSFFLSTSHEVRLYDRSDDPAEKLAESLRNLDQASIENFSPSDKVIPSPSLHSIRYGFIIFSIVTALAIYMFSKEKGFFIQNNDPIEAAKHETPRELKNNTPVAVEKSELLVTTNPANANVSLKNDRGEVAQGNRIKTC